ncbi:hypothetical protein [Halobacillus sp. Marseille-P3879]|uniref:hypothetical protein n=1 Tax=Halobacillus sp. Marseille-P3879 TaxID=2045014 RepID=UPI000C7B5D93|nr:hypothetical protein [Halobacillus sp. Marseille-P3879]
MKVTLIFIFMLISMQLITFLLDLLMGLERDSAISNLLNPFWVMEPFEYLLLVLLLLIPLTNLLIKFIIKKKKFNED